MKKTQNVATLAFAFMLGIVVPLTQIFSTNNAYAMEQESGLSTPSSSYQADDIPADSTGIVQATTPEQIAQAVTSADTTEIILSNDITVPATSTYTNGILMYRNLDLAPLRLNLNGHTLTFQGNQGLHILFGSFVITGQGTISAKQLPLIVKGSYDSRFTDYTTVVVDSGVTIDSPNGYGLIVDQTARDGAYDPHAYGVKVEFNGTINAMQGAYINGSIKHTDNPAQITLGDTAKINASEVAIYAAGYANWQIGTATITGNTGVGIKSGTITLTNANITGMAEHQDPTPDSGRMDSTGAVFQIEHHTSYADQITLNIHGGTYTSKHSDVFHEYGEITATSHARGVTDVADINIYGGTFTAGDNREIFGGTIEDDQVDIEISGGTFKGTDVANFKANGYLVGNLAINADGTVYRPSGNHSGSDVEAPEGPSDPETPSDPTPDPDASQTENKVPDTGLVSGHGIIGAVSTVTPLLIAAGFAFMFFSGKIHERERQRRLASIESEINAEVEQIIDESEPEPTLDHFVAVPIDRDEPTLTPVDPFISRK